jgi:hypothetical protein
MSNEQYDWMDEALQIAAQCWCDAETSDRVMDPVLAEAVAKRIAAWMRTAAQADRNTDFYRDLIVQIGKTFGDAAKTADDGTIMDDVLALRVPELVEALQSRTVELEADLRGAPRCPTCNSSNPRLHPAMQVGGEVQVCSNSWHTGG